MCKIATQFAIALASAFADIAGRQRGAERSGVVAADGRGECPPSVSGARCGGCHAAIEGGRAWTFVLSNTLRRGAREAVASIGVVANPLRLDRSAGPERTRTASVASAEVPA